MKWLLICSFLIVFTISCEGKESSKYSRRDREHLEAECLAGSEWESNCHRCICSHEGIAECTRNEECSKELSGLEPIRCKPNTSFKRDCNTCRCLENGLGFCTLMFCIPNSNLELKDPLKAHHESSKRCAPGSKWKSQCRNCECSQDGDPICDLIDCPGHSNEPLFVCAPQTTWNDDCSFCWCTSKGQPFCSRNGCIGEANMNFDNDLKLSKRDEEYFKELDRTENMLNSVHNVIRRSPCKPNQNFQNDCNTCKCSPDGLNYKCTQNECMDKEDTVNKEVEVFMENEGVDHIERHSVCQPQGTFYIGCNTCHCNPFGSDYSCTNKPCPLPDDVELFHELKENPAALKQGQKIVCVANRMFIKDCNTCWCNEDGTGFICTRRVCLHDLDRDKDDDSEELRILLRKCRPNEVFELDCNMCRCNNDGQSYSCTRRACFEEPAVKPISPQKDKADSRRIRAVSQEAPKACKPGQNFRMDCNICRCNNDGKSYSCTRRACFEEPTVSEQKDSADSRRTRAVAQEAPKACKPGQEFRMDCNKCLCDNEGLDFSCTRNDCRTTVSDNKGSARRRREVNRQAVNQCTPGSVFEQDCNVCRCASDGHHATCTLKRCSLKPAGDKKQDDAATDSDPNFRCNPGEQFKRGCNDCTCSADGKSVFCTLLLCDKEVYQS